MADMTALEKAKMVLIHEFITLLLIIINIL